AEEFAATDQVQHACVIDADGDADAELEAAIRDRGRRAQVVTDGERAVGDRSAESAKLANAGLNKSVAGVAVGGVTEELKSSEISFREPTATADLAAESQRIARGIDPHGDIPVERDGSRPGIAILADKGSASGHGQGFVGDAGLVQPECAVAA